MKPRILIILVLSALFFSFQMKLIAGDKNIAPRLEPIEQEFSPDYSKPGGIVIGPSMTRAFHYGGRHSVRDTAGYLHVSWEEPDYNFNYYSRSLDTVGAQWTDPINPHETFGVELEDGTVKYEVDRALMAKMALDPRTGYLYMMPFHRINAGERYKTGITRSTDGGENWTPYLDLGRKINRPDEEVSWGTMAIGYDPNDNNKTILHIVYAKNNTDAMYTRADLTVIDDPSDPMSDLLFTRSDGVTVGDEAISYVPSGVVFQGTIILDRNNDPHIIFSGDGGADTFGDKTPYHIYYKSAANSWGPIPPQRLMAELEVSWGMPEIVFDQNNRGYYFLDKNDPYYATTFGTWEPPTDPTSPADFGTLNATDSTYGFGSALDLIYDEKHMNFPGLEGLIDSTTGLYLPQADVDDANDIVYFAASTGSYYDRGDIVILALENASQYSHTTPPSQMDWQVFRWVTSDGFDLGDMGPDMVYDPSSSKIDIFWSGAGPVTWEAQFLPAHIPPACKDAMAKLIKISIPGEKIFVNEGDEIGIVGVVKNNGTCIMPPALVIATVSDSDGVELFTGSYQAPPLGAGLETSEIVYGSWPVVGDRQRFSISLAVSLPDDEATYNDVVGTSFFVYPNPDNAYGWDAFQDTNYTNFPTYLADGTHFITDPPDSGWYRVDAWVDGWTVLDSSHGNFGDARDEYISTWVLYINTEAGDTTAEGLPENVYAQIRHMQGVRNDTLFGGFGTDDLPPGYTDSSYAQPQNELLYSPVYSLGNTENLADSVQIRFQWKNPNNNGSYATWSIDNLYVVERGSQVTLNFSDGGSATLDPEDTHYPLTANIDLSIDGGTTWLAVLHREATLEGTPEDVKITYLSYADLDITDLLTSIGVNDGISTVPKSYALHQNYPNPFNPRTMIQFDIPEAGDVRIDIHNLLGQKVMTLVNGYVTAGSHKVGFDASDLSSGVYLYTLRAGNYTAVKKLVLLK